MPKETFLDTAEDMTWLRDVHLPGLPAKYMSAILYGNEDAPDSIDVYEDESPMVEDTPVRFLSDPDGVYHEAPQNIEIVSTVDDGWMVLSNGFQAGGSIDRSGAGNAEFDKWNDALEFAWDFVRRSKRGAKEPRAMESEGYDTFDTFTRVDMDDLSEGTKYEIKNLEPFGVVFLGATYKGMPVFSLAPGAGVGAEKELKSWGYKKKIRMLNGRKSGSFWAVT